MMSLFITHHYLSSNGGGSFASRAFINAFAEISDEMTLMYPVRRGEDLFEDINPKIETIPVAYDIPKWRKLWQLLIGRVHRFYEKAAEISNQRHFDRVVFDTSVVSYNLIDLFKNAGSRIIVIHHNYQYEYFRDDTFWWLKFPTLFWCRRYEREAVRKADLNLTLTKQDIKLLSENYNNGDDSNFRLLGTFEYKPLPPRVFERGESNGHSFVITGNLGAIQTKQSLIPWIRDCFPILMEVFPDSELTIAGKDPDKVLTGICQKRGIQLIPSPKSMDFIMRDADYYICPVNLGGGIKLRIMDGLKWGLPVIAHTVSARGYDLFVEEGSMLVYSDADGFKDALMTLRQGAFSKEKVLNDYYQYFSFESGVKRLVWLLNM